MKRRGWGLWVIEKKSSPLAGEATRAAARAGEGVEWGLPLNPSPRSASLSRPLPQGERGELAAVSDTPELDLRLLRDAARDDAGFASFIARRLTHEPVAYITGTRGFWTIDLDVTPAVLIPRPDSETLIDAAVAHFGAKDSGQGPKRVLDLGTGSGALLLAALDQWPGATGVGVDASEDALAVARGNAGRIAPGRAEMRLGDWTVGIDEAFDLVLCNPPYVETGADLDPQVRDYEPASALFAGADGLDDYRILAPQLGRVMAGIACIEIGHTQAAAVTALLENEGFTVTCRKDLGGRDRCLVAKRK
jgi:release factor glutamine methyltransferase